MTYYNLNGEIHIAQKSVAKTLLEKLASVVVTVLSDIRDIITLNRDSIGMVLAFDLRFDTETERNNIRDWLVERHSYATKGVICEHTCNDSHGSNCTDYTEILKWGDWD